MDRILLLLFFFSGFAGLVYEIVWARILALSFGTTVGANAVVIAAYMAGLGLGSLFWGRRADRVKNRLKLFALLEFGTGAAALVLVFVFLQIPPFYKMLYNSLKITGNTALFVMFLFSFILIFVPTFLMGGTFPVMSKAFIKKESKIGAGVGKLYALNTVGGVAGIVVAGFLLIGNLGQIATQLIAVVINLILGLISLSTRLPERNAAKEPGTKRNEPGRVSFQTADKLVLIAAGITGFAGLAFEVFWLRTLAIFLANSTYTFMDVLAIYLAGLFFGSIVYAKFLFKRNQVKTLALALVCTGFYAVVSVLFINRLPDLLYAFRSIIEVPLFRITLPGFLLASALLLVPAIMMGISFPAICAIYNRNIEHVGRGMGRVYLVNTAGSVAGSLLAAFVIIPALGISRGIIVIGVLSLVAGLAAANWSRSKRFIIAAGMISLVGIFTGAFNLKQQVILPPSLFRTPGRSDRILYYNETKDGTVIVSEDRFTGIRACYVNNSAVIGTTYDALKVVQMLGHLPFIYNPGARQALVVGFGVGVTTASLAEHGVLKIDCVEICPGVKEGARYFVNFNNSVFKNPKVNFLSGDGRNYLLLSNKKYDVISCDPTHPTLGSGGLYTKEYFELCRQHLNEDGVVCQYLPLHKLTLSEFKTLINTFAAVFPGTSVWLAHSHGILVGTTKPQAIDFQILGQIKSDILNDPYLTAISLILDAGTVKTFTTSAGMNTDDLPVLEFFKPGSLLRENWEKNIAALMDYRVDPNTVFLNIEDQEKLSRYLESQAHFIRGLIYQNRGDARAVIEEFRKALEINPENEEIKMFLENELKEY